MLLGALFLYSKMLNLRQFFFSLNPVGYLNFFGINIFEKLKKIRCFFSPNFTIKVLPYIINFWPGKQNPNRRFSKIKELVKEPSSTIDSLKEPACICMMFLENFQRPGGGGGGVALLLFFFL